MKIINEVLIQYLPPEFQLRDVYYFEKINMFGTKEYKNYLGTIYYTGIMLSENIIILYDLEVDSILKSIILNGFTINIQLNNLGDKIVAKSYCRQEYNVITIKEEAKKLLKEELSINQKDKLTFTKSSMIKCINNLVEDAFKNQIETLCNIHLQVMRYNSY